MLFLVPKTMQQAAVQDAHDAITFGHLGVSRTYDRIKDRYYFPGCLEKITRFVASYELCKHKNNLHGPNPGYLQPLPVKGPFVRFHVDFTGLFPITARRNTYIILGIDPVTKYVVAKAVSAATTCVAAKFLVENVIFKRGMINELLTDRISHFQGAVMQQVIALLNVKHLLTSAYHSQCDGQAKRAIQTLFRVLSHYVNDYQKNWNLVVPFAEWCLNTMRQEMTGYTPFELVYGRKAVTSLDLGMSFDGLETVKDPCEYAGLVFQWLKTARDVALANINSSHDVTAPRFNNKRVENEFQPGNFVLE